MKKALIGLLVLASFSGSAQTDNLIGSGVTDHPGITHLKKHIKNLSMTGKTHTFESRFKPRSIDANQVFGCINKKCALMTFSSTTLQVDLTRVFRQKIYTNVGYRTDYMRRNMPKSLDDKDKLCQNFLGENFYAIEGSEVYGLTLVQNPERKAKKTLTQLNCIYK